MTSVEKNKYFYELYQLLNVYSYKRDQVVDNQTENFFEKVQSYCDYLDLDYDTLKKQFNLLEPDDFV